MESLMKGDVVAVAGARHCLRCRKERGGEVQISTTDDLGVCVVDKIK